MKRTLGLLLLALALGPAGLRAQSTATYTVLFDATWSATTHPAGFPPGPHFSGLIGATHDGTVTFWTPGDLASPGIESMAETGSKAALRSEVEAMVQTGAAGTVLSGDGIRVSPGTALLSFDVTDRHPRVTLVSMLAPSPDWFVGVSGLTLFVDGQWIERAEVPLFTYDAGTDSGPSYTSPDEDTVPALPIARLETEPFLVDGTVTPVGTFTFVRQTATARDPGPPEEPATHRLSAAFPNPFRAQATLLLTVSRRQQVRADVWDLRGRRVATLLDAALAPGNLHRLTLDGTGLPAGVYLVRLHGETFRESRPVVRLR